MFTDKYAVKKFEELVKQYGIKSVIETGTYKADSTIRFAEIVENVYSIEIDEFNYEWAKWRTKDYKNIHLFLGNSPDVISQIIETIPEPICFYLDAHWKAYWPLKDEIRAIKPRPNSIIIIHDVKVPNKDFGYDTWKGMINEYETIKNELAYVNPNYKISYNEQAEGNYRGILYVT